MREGGIRDIDRVNQFHLNILGGTVTLVSITHELLIKIYNEILKTC